MKISNMKFSSLLIACLLLSLFFQDNLMLISDIFSYLDEVVSILFFGYFLFYSLITHKIEKEDLLIIFLITVISIITFGYNIFYSVQDSIKPAIIDFVAIFKFLFIFLGAKCFLSHKIIDKENVLSITNFFVKMYIIILLVFAFLNFFYKLNMDVGYRYGFPMFCFNLGVPGILINQMTYSLLLLSFDSKNKFSNKLFIYLSMIVMLTTMKTRAFILIALYLILYLFIIKKIKFNKYLIGFAVALVVIFIGYGSFEYYFLGDSTPRQLFLLSGIDLFIRYFPFGTGFGTFGSSAAAKFYSPFYYYYGFNDRWGLSIDNQLYLSDNYIPMIIAQFGFICTILFTILLFIYCKKIYKESQIKYNNIKLIGLFYILDILLSSIQSSYLAHYSCVTLTFLCVFLIYSFKNKKIIKKGDKVLNTN